MAHTILRLSINMFLFLIAGGYDGNSRQCLSSVEVYNPDQVSIKWTLERLALSLTKGLSKKTLLFQNLMC